MLLYMLAFYSLFAITSCCECAIEPTVNRSYCKADLVAHVKVVNLTIHDAILADPSQINSESEYEVEIIDILKKSKEFDLVSPINVIHTPPTGGSCGFPIDPKSKNKEWLLYAKVNGNLEFIIDICSKHQHWDKDLKKQMQALSKFNCSELFTTKQPKI